MRLVRVDSVHTHVKNACNLVSPQSARQLLQHIVLRGGKVSARVGNVHLDVPHQLLKTFAKVIVAPRNIGNSHLQLLHATTPQLLNTTPSASERIMALMFHISSCEV